MKTDLTGITSLRFGTKLRYEDGRLILGENADAPSVPLSTSSIKAEPPADLDLATLQAFYDLYFDYMSTPKGRAIWTNIGRNDTPVAVVTLDALLSRLGHAPDDDDDDGSLYVFRKSSPLSCVTAMLGHSNCSVLGFSSYDPETDSAVFAMPFIAKLIRDDRGVDVVPRDPAVIRGLDPHISFRDGRLHIGSDDERGTILSIWDCPVLRRVAEFDPTALRAYYEIVLEEAAKPDILANLNVSTVFRVELSRLLDKLSAAGVQIPDADLPKYVENLTEDLGSFHVTTFEVAACFLMFEGYDPETDMISFTAPSLVDWIIGRLVASGRNAA